MFFHIDGTKERSNYHQRLETTLGNAQHFYESLVECTWRGAERLKKTGVGWREIKKKIAPVSCVIMVKGCVCRVRCGKEGNIPKHPAAHANTFDKALVGGLIIFVDTFTSLVAT